MSLPVPVTVPPPQASLPNEPDKLNKPQATKKRERGVGKGNKTKKETSANNAKAPQKAKIQTSRKPPTKRTRKNDLTATDDSSNPSINAILPSPPGSPKSIPTTTLPVKPQSNRHTGRQHAGAYTREQVRALQTYINTKILPDWDDIAQHVGKATGVYRHKDNLRTFYGTIVLRQLYECFPDKDGQGGELIVVDVKEVDKEAEGQMVKGRVCGGCGAKLVEGLPEEWNQKGVREEVQSENGIPMIEERKQDGEMIDDEQLVQPPGAGSEVQQNSRLLESGLA